MAELESIPLSWKSAVIAILEREDEQFIRWTERAFLEWRSATSSAWKYEAYQAMAEALRDPHIQGQKVFLPMETGESWAFGIAYGGRRLYCKICLAEGQLRIKIISAHIPLKPDKF